MLRFTAALSCAFATCASAKVPDYRSLLAQTDDNDVVTTVDLG